LNDRYDLIVVGCGAAGLSAALAHQLEAQRQGRAANIAILEVAPKVDRGGATRWTTAAFRIRSDDRLDPMWVGTVADVSNGLSDLDYCRRFEKEVPASIAMLKDSNVEIIYYPGGLANVTGTGGAGPNGGGHAIVDALAARLETFTGTAFFYETEALSLVQNDDGEVTGAVVRNAEGRRWTLRANAVVLACGGFEGNSRMLTQYVGPKACDLKLIAPGIAYNKGAGIQMAIDVGADTAGQFDGIHSELVDIRSDKADAVVLNHPFGIVVNGEGERFFDEGIATFDATFELIAYEVWRNQNSKAFIILDQQTLKQPTLNALVYSHVPPVEGNTIGEIAEQLGLEPDALEATVAKYNAATRPGTLDPSRLDGWASEGLMPPKSNWAFPLSEPPFAAYPVTTAITFTYGGLKTDTEARVIGTNGHPIPGLYAAGELVGLFYHEYPAGTSVLKALTFGRIAGTHTAARYAEVLSA
jgi:tricarballylate dehydrogenase